MAEELYLLHPADTHFKKGDNCIYEEVLEDPSAAAVKGLKPKTKLVKVVRTFLFFAENLIATHPIFSMKHGYARSCAAMRIIDAIAKSEPGEWFPLRVDDVGYVKSILADPGVGLGADEKAAIREMTHFEITQFREMFDAFLNTRTSPPDKD